MCCQISRWNADQQVGGDERVKKEGIKIGMREEGNSMEMQLEHAVTLGKRP